MHPHIESRSMPEPNSGCWLWLGWCNRYGYGEDRSNAGRTRRAHRLSYELSRGPIPKGMMVCHKCDVRSCVNPDHLFIGTAKQNTADMLAKGRHWAPRGEAGSASKITAKQATAIFNSTEPQAALARAYGIARETVRAIKRGNSWGHLDLLAEPHRPLGRPCRGKELPTTKLTADQVVAIFHDRRTQQVIADEYGVARSNVSRIKSGRTWKHLNLSRAA